MKANKLMIGDLVQTNGKSIKIEEIVSDWHYGQKEMKYAINPEYEQMEIVNFIEEFQLQPIPLTTEILEKNGFQKQEEERGFSEPYTVYVNDDYRLPIKIYPKEIMDRYRHLYIGDYDDDPFISLYINYVHELQHALRLVGCNELADNLKV